MINTIWTEPGNLVHALFPFSFVSQLVSCMFSYQFNESFNYTGININGDEKYPGCTYVTFEIIIAAVLVSSLPVGIIWLLASCHVDWVLFVSVAFVIALLALYFLYYACKSNFHAFEGFDQTRLNVSRYIYIYILYNTIYRHVFRCSTAHQCSLVQSINQSIYPTIHPSIWFTYTLTLIYLAKMALILNIVDKHEHLVVGVS